MGIGRVDFEKDLNRSEICDTFKFCSVESAKCSFKAGGDRKLSRNISVSQDVRNICKKICEEVQIQLTVNG